MRRNLEKKLNESIYQLGLMMILKIRNQQLKLFIENNKNFESRVKAFEVEYNNTNEEDRPVLMAKLVDMLDEYKSVLKQIPLYLDAISSVAVSYVNSKEKYKELPMKDIFDTILKKANEVKVEYNNEVKPLFDISPEIKKLIFDIS